MHKAHTIAATALLLLGLPAIVSAIDYFPTAPGPVFNYVLGPITIRSGPDGAVWRDFCAGCFVAQTTSYRIDSNGDVLLEGLASYCEAAPDPSGTSYWPHVLYLDMPLVSGKTWVTDTVESPYWSTESHPLRVTGTVAGPQMAAVPAGTFEVFIVTLSYEYTASPWMNRTEELWLQRQLGPVNDLVSWTGVVGNAEVTWGSLKSLYR